MKWSEVKWSEVAQSCPTLLDPMDHSLSGSSVHGIFQARVLEWTAISFSRGSSNPGIDPRSPTLQADALPSEPPGKSPLGIHIHINNVHAQWLQSCPTLCDPMDCSLPGSSVHGILWARILEWATMPSSRGSSWSRDRTQVSYVSCIGRWILYH